MIDTAGEPRIEPGSSEDVEASTASTIDATGADHASTSYDVWASIYDRYWNHRLFDGALRRLVLVDIPPPARLLDLGCGAGHQAKRLADAGYDVTGVDVSARMLDHARRRAPDCEFMLADVRDFGLRDVPPFDVVYSFYDTLNHILDGDGLLSVFRSVRRVLRTGGIFIFDLNTEEAFRTRWQETLTIVEDDLVLVGEGDYDPETRLGDYRITALERADAPGFEEGARPSWVRRDARVRERCHPSSDVTAALDRAGFADVFRTSAEDAGMERSLHRVFYVAR